MKISIRLRFALWTTCLLIFSMALFGTVVVLTVERRLYVSFDESLRASASESIAAMNIEFGRMNLSDGSMTEIAAASQYRGFSLRVLDIETRKAVSFGELGPVTSAQAAEMSDHRDKSRFGSVEGQGGVRLRTFTTSIVEESRIIGVMQVARSTEPIYETLQQLATTLAFAAPFFALLSGVGGYLLARRALAPIDRITRAARSITAESLGHRLNASGSDDEIGRLAATFDEMISRLDRSFQREKQFTSDVSHELRTPLTAMQAIVHFLLDRERSSDEQAAALRDLDLEVSRLRTLTEEMLALVRNEQTGRAETRPTDLSTVLDDLSDSMEPLAREKGLTLTRTIQNGLLVIGSDDELIRLFLNILDNAIKYTERGGIELRAALGEGGRIVVTIVDSGMGIQAGDLARIFDRFYRSESARRLAGSGLGLSIAQRIAQSLGGGISVDSRLGEGSRFTVDLPAAQTDDLRKSRAGRRRGPSVASSAR